MLSSTTETQRAYHSEALLPACDLALAGLLVLGPPCLELVSDGLLTNVLSLLLVDGLHEHALVLEVVSLDLQRPLPTCMSGKGPESHTFLEFCDEPFGISQLV